jgi:chorismate-pyruvate lyase
MSFTSSISTPPKVLPYAHPLDEFYANAGLVLPRIETAPGVSLPEPYRRLLVHEGDMTPALEAFHKTTLHVEVLRSEERNSFYYREVVLMTDDDSKPVEFGAIKISLERVSLAARKDILAERLPFGTVLARHKIAHTSRPKAFLKIHSDDFINQALGLNGGHVLWGRRNTLSNLSHEPLTEIVEILPPAEL